ncbi:hypothetical protein Cni_G25171 [Canna indica]|uniref:glutathione transferase n=1 Tax=Canna indica TaxID=4628 RepID=A0AAQ3KX69_9LILI|nr:hypothetical protein Cni_G25171 [Canna indica]
MDRPSSSSSSSLKLLGSWADSHTHRVQLALKLKGLEFEYQEEDFLSPSPDLLHHNPVYKKVPVLLHDGRAVLDSVIALQFIDEAWPAAADAPLMPADPFDRAAVRFWCHFADDKLGPAVGLVFSSSGEGQKAAVEQVHENLKLLEGELREGAFKGRRFFGGDRIGLLDIVLGCGSYWLAVFEEVMEVKLVDPEAFPFFSAWLREFEEQKEVKETIPAIDKLLEYARGIRQMMLSMGSATAATANGATTSATGNASVDAVDSSSAA